MRQQREKNQVKLMGIVYNFKEILSKRDKESSLSIFKEFFFLYILLDEISFKAIRRKSIIGKIYRKDDKTNRLIYDTFSLLNCSHQNIEHRNSSFHVIIRQSNRQVKSYSLNPI